MTTANKVPTLKKIELLDTQLSEERRLVSFDSYDLSVRQLLDMFETDAVVIPPEYQRQFVWQDERQSSLIESVFLGIPIPSLFMATNIDSTWEVVDGVQRLCTLSHFAGSPELLKRIKRDKPLTIQGLEKLNSLDSLRYQDLPKSIQLKFMTRPIRVTVLNDKSDLEVRFDLFERLNTGGVSLTAQEIRNCVFRGPLNNTIKELAADEDFCSVIRLKPVDQSNGTKEELVLRFFAFLEGYKEFEHSVKDFLNTYMKERAGKPLAKAQISSFHATFSFLKHALPHGIVRGARAITPINLYEAISVGTALALDKDPALEADVVRALLNDQELRKWTTGATNSQKMVSGRIEFVRDKLR